MNRKKIGIFGGSFDPIHLGHLNMAISCQEKCFLDEVWWLPAQVNPLKHQNPVEGSHRLEMLKIALQSLSSHKIIDFEILKDSPSYTVDTLRFLAKTPGKGGDFYLMMGEDTFSRFEEWKEPEEILKLAKLLICTRKIPNLELRNKFNIPSESFIDLPFFDISATTIRKRLKEGRYSGHLVPFKVLDYIREHGLYS